MSITKQVELINKKEFAKAALNKNIKTFVIYILFPYLGLKNLIHNLKKTQIALLLIKKAIILIKYLDFFNIFLEKKSFGVIKDNLS